ncbi:uncharacterized protein LOC120331920 [Styela clava]
MEVGIQVHHRAEHNHNNNVNKAVVNGSVNGSKMPHSHHTKNTTTVTSGQNYHSTNKPNSNYNKDDNQKPSAEETKQQTDKIMKVFFKSIVDKNGVAEQIRKESRQRYESQGSVSAQQSQSNKIVTNYHSQRPSTSDGRSERQTPIRVPLRKESNDEALQKVMRGEIPNSLRHRSDASSDSADSELYKERFKRSKSFSKAQRHSIVTELENRSPKTTSRRNSEDIRQTSPLESSQEYSLKGAYDKKAGSPISHTRAVSDPVIVRNDVTGKHRNKEKEKDKDKKKFWKRKKKKKEGQKSKEDSVDIASSSQKVHRNHSDRLSREDSTASKRRSPSPPTSPKRTPKLFRRFSKRKKGGRPETPLTESSSSSKSTSRSKSLEFDAIHNETPPNGDSKSSSLPMEVNFSTKSTSEIKNKEGRSQQSVQFDSIPTAGKRNRKNSEEVVRPNTLDLPQKKKPQSTFKKFKKFIFDSSSSSSSDSEEEEFRNQRISGSQSRQTSVSRGHSLQEDTRRRTSKNSNLEEPSVDDVRDRYQHRATKSMSDIDPIDKNCSEIALKLRRVAEQYVIHYGGPTGRTQTPESYRHELHREIKHGKKPPVKKAVARAATLPTPVQSHSMKAYLNMKEGTRNVNFSADSRLQRRITRDEIDHRPSRSLDSPRGSENGARWSDRINKERAPRTQEVPNAREPRLDHHVGTKPKDKLDSSSAMRRSNAIPSPPAQSGPPRSSRHHHRPSDNFQSQGASSPAPEPTRSSSPHLRASRSTDRHRGPSLDQLSHDHHAHRHIERHIDRTTTVSSPGRTRRVVTHVDVYEDIEADALPSAEDQNDGGDEGFGAGFDDVADGLDDDTEIVEQEETTTTTVTEEISNCSASRPLIRQRAATSPEIRPYLPLEDEDNDLDNIDVPGAVGGVDPDAEIDEDKLVAKILEALRKKADRIELETPQLEDALNRTLARLSKEKVKEIMNRALSTIAETTSSHVRHPEIVQIALLFNMAQLFVRVSTQPSLLSGIVNSIINPIVEGFGGWSRVQSSLDETEKEMTNLDSDEPGTSGLTNFNQQRRKSDVSDPDSDLD